MSVLPQLNEEWQWVEDTCLVVKTTSCESSELDCKASAEVILDTGPICDERKCDKRRGTVPAPPGDSDADKVWLLIHGVNTTHTCWERSESGEVTFRSPHVVETSEILLPFLLSAIFFLPSCVFIPAFMKHDSSAARLLDRLGLRHTPDVDQQALVASTGKDGLRQHSQSILMDNLA